MKEKVKKLIKEIIGILVLSLCISGCNASTKNITFDQAEIMRNQAEYQNLSPNEKEKSYRKLTSIYENIAKEGNAEAQFILGDIYSRGLGGEHDEKKAFLWTKKAADNGEVQAAVAAAMYYQMGLGVNENLSLAETYYLKAVNKNDVQAQFLLGAMYIENGKNQEGLELLKKAAQQNDVDAMFNLGLIYCDGKLLKKDYKVCNSYWTKAAELGHAEAAFNVGINFQEGYGEQSIDKAIQYFKMASERNHGKASYNLGIIYSYKQSGHVNPDLAKLYFEKAKEQGVVHGENLE